MSSQAERSTTDEDEQAKSDEDDGEQDVLPAFESFRDGASCSHELSEPHKDDHEGEEDRTVGDDGGRPDIQEYRDIDPDVVATVGEGHGSDSQDTNLFTGNFRLVVVIVVVSVAPYLPCNPKTQQQGYEAEVRNGLLGKESTCAERDEYRSAQDPDETEVLPTDDAGCGSSLSRSAGEEQGEDDDVIDVGKKEQADGRKN